MFNSLGMSFEYISIIQEYISREEKIAAEMKIMAYINYLKSNNKTAETAIVYLTDMKNYLNYKFKYYRRKPLLEYIALKISNCKMTSKRKLNTAKYKD